MIASVSPPRVTILHGTYTIQKYTSSSAHQTSFMKREICSLAQRPRPHRHMLRRGSRKQRQWASSRAKRGARNSNTEIDYHHPHKKPRFVHPTNPQFQLRQLRQALLKKNKTPSRYHSPIPDGDYVTIWTAHIPHLSLGKGLFSDTALGL